MFLRLGRRLTVSVKRDHAMVLSFARYGYAVRGAIMTWARDDDGRRRVRFSVWDLTTLGDALLFKLGPVYGALNERAPQVRFPRFVRHLAREVRRGWAC